MSRVYPCITSPSNLYGVLRYVHHNFCINSDLYLFDSRLEIAPAMKLPVKPGAGFVFASAHHFLLSRAISSLLIICWSMTYQRTIYLSNDIITKGIQYVIETVKVISH